MAALAKKLEASLRQVDDFSFVLLFRLGVRFDLAVGNASNVFDNVVGLSDLANQRLIFRFEQLQQCPDSNVLESGVARLQESAQISVNASVGLVPVLDENGVVAN